MGNSEIWYKETAEANLETLNLVTSTTIPINTSITVTVYEDVGNDNTGPSSVTDPSGTTHNYENTDSATLTGGTDEGNSLTGFNSGGSDSAYIIRVELDGDGSDPTLEIPELDELELEV